MRGKTDPQPQFFYQIDIEARIRPDHPLRMVKRRVDAILTQLSPRFDAAYGTTGRPSVPPETLLKALLIQAIYSIRSERQLCERIDTDLLFRWFLDLSPEDPAFDPTVFTHNRPRMDQHGITAAFFDAVVAQAIDAGLCSDDHFSVDGTLIQAYGSMKSFQPKEETTREDSDDGPRPDSNGFHPSNPDVDFRGQKRSNATHRSVTDPEAKLYRKGLGKEAKLAHMGHTLCENRHGLVVDICVSEASGTAERTAALAMIDRHRRVHGAAVESLGADAGYDDGGFVRALEDRRVATHVAMSRPMPADPSKAAAGRREKIKARLRNLVNTKTVGYAISQQKRKLAEEPFGWSKTIGGLGRSRFVGRWKLIQQAHLVAAAYDLLRMNKLCPI